MRDIIYRPMCSTNMVNCLFDGFNHGYPLPQHPFGMQGLRLGATAGRRFLAATVVQVYPILALAIVSSVSDTCSPGLAFILPLHVITFGCDPLSPPVR